MKICIIGAGHMGTWLVEEFCHDHEVAVYDLDKNKMKYFYNVKRMMDLSEIKDFAPDMLINAVELDITIKVFESVLEFLPQNCILCDITAVKTGMKDFYSKNKFRYVSTHPMFGPTSLNVRDLSSENAIIIDESDEEGKKFFADLYKKLKLHVYYYSFEKHDEVTAYSLSVPFLASLVFALSVKDTDVPGATFSKHLNIVRGLLSEDDYLIAGVLFNPNSLKQVEEINSKLSYLTHIIKAKEHDVLKKLLNNFRENIK